MTKQEEILLFAMYSMTDVNTLAITLQTFIQEHGPLTEDGASEVRKLLNERKVKIEL